MKLNDSLCLIFFSFPPFFFAFRWKGWKKLKFYYFHFFFIHFSFFSFLLFYFLFGSFFLLPPQLFPLCTFSFMLSSFTPLIILFPTMDYCCSLALPLNNQRTFIYHETNKPNQTKPFFSPTFLSIFSVPFKSAVVYFLFHFSSFFSYLSFFFPYLLFLIVLWSVLSPSYFSHFNYVVVWFAYFSVAFSLWPRFFSFYLFISLPFFLTALWKVLVRLWPVYQNLSRTLRNAEHPFIAPRSTLARHGSTW